MHSRYGKLPCGNDDELSGKFRHRRCRCRQRRRNMHPTLQTLPRSHNYNFFPLSTMKKWRMSYSGGRGIRTACAVRFEYSMRWIPFLREISRWSIPCIYLTVQFDRQPVSALTSTCNRTTIFHNTFGSWAQSAHANSFNQFLRSLPVGKLMKVARHTL